MLPTRIKIHNLGAIPEAEIDLTGIFCASILGANGAGKSTFFTWAVNYALYGKTKNNCSVDDMVRKGTTDMWVQLEFEHNNEVYQVTRGRSIKSKQGKSSCELQKRTSTGWESLTEAKIADTDKKIEQLLSLDYNTFISSSMILQNDSGRFAQSLPSERKIVLSQILGLDIYSTLQEKAKDRAKSLELKLEVSKQELSSLEEKLKALPEVEAKLAEVKKSLTLVACDIRQKETELADIQAQIKELEQKQQEAERIEKQIETLTQEIIDKKTEIDVLQLKIMEAEDILLSEPEILQKIAELEEIKAQIPALQAKEDKAQELRANIKRIDEEKYNLSTEDFKLLKRTDQLNKDLSLRDELKESAEQYQQGLEELKEQDKLLAQYQDLMNQIREVEKQTDPLADRLYEIKADIGKTQTTLKGHQKKLEILQSSGCPNPENATCKFLQDANEAKALIPSVEAELKEKQEEYKQVESVREPLMQELVLFDQKYKELQYDPKNHTDLKNRVESLRQQAEQYAQLSSKEELLQNLNEQRQNLSQRITALDEQRISLNAEIKTLEAETENLPILKAKIPSLEVYVKQKDKLPEAKAVIQTSKEAIAKLDAEITAKEAEKRQLEIDLVLFDDYPRQHIKALCDQTAIQEAIGQLQQDQNRLFASQGVLTNQLNTLTLDKQKHDSLSQELAPQAKELVRWQTLVKAFSKNGIPALIIENAIPELERISNDILSQMSGGANTLQFITQRDAKSKDSMIETLDILVSDWAGTRPLESYSGGEQTRISLAIRFALSELLVNRSGSKIEFLIMDEVLSDQSPEFRDLTVEAIKNLKDRFKKILLISHIPEIQNAFEQRIILSEGGRVAIQFN